MADVDLETRAARHAALADVHRLAIVDLLRLGDASPRELQDRLSQHLSSQRAPSRPPAHLGSNLLAHHVGVLERAGLVNRRRSEADRRRAYLRLVPENLPDDVPGNVATELAGVPVADVTGLVFVCTQNAARSQLAAALWNRDRPNRAPTASSAGTHPAPRVEPRAIEVADRRGLRLGARPVGLDPDLLGGALVVTVCDAAHEELAAKLSAGLSAVTLHWSVPDPVPTRGRAAFEAAADDLERRVATLARSVTPARPTSTTQEIA